MGLLRKKIDPISDRARAINDEIARLESQIKKLDARLQRNGSHPRLRSTALPHGPTINRATTPDPNAVPPTTTAHEPIFEEVDQNRLNAHSDAGNTPEHYNELGG